ncbi:Protein TWIN LOV 1 [Vitis vinifera]|uniref:Protein TWIN LOV 1 n=1 Tax=Vitis vinifera TaxID=29760 RepID=A0A438D736_VITVI|nr:Protein TWIN LOV 1 [Vitis vinifera]
MSRKPRWSGSGPGRDGVCEDGCRSRDIVFGSCRREVCSDSVLELEHVLAFESLFDSDNRDDEEPREASDQEKRRAAAAVNNILSLLTHYSELTGKLVCEKRCTLSGIGLLGASLIISLGRIKQSFVLTDPHLPEMPIVYASDAFLKLTGYARHEVLGCQCMFLSGVDTDPSTLLQVKESIQTEQACTVRILNYRKDRSSFWNLLHISPVRNASGKVSLCALTSIEFMCEEGTESIALRQELKIPVFYNK